VPIPGPRTQYGPVPGYDNPGGEQPTRFNHWDRPGPIWWPGRSPGTMIVDLRGCRLAVGQIRRLYRQTIDYIAAQAPYSWTTNAPQPGRPESVPLNGVGITRALRYMTRSVYMGSGIDNSRYDNMHTVVMKQNTYKTVTVNSGQVRNRPTTRNRMSSFGSRVPILNQQVAAAENQKPGQATQA
jgi:hypothetical protein